MKKSILACIVLVVTCLFFGLPRTGWSQAPRLKTSDFVIFGGNTNVAGKGVQLGSAITISSGDVGSYSLIRSTGSVVMGGGLHSGGTIDLTNSNTIQGSITAANSLNKNGTILKIGSNAIISGDIDVQGNIVISGGLVNGKVTHPAGTSYSGPTPKGGDITGIPSIPALPDMPAINTFPAAGTTTINNSAEITPGSYGNMVLTGNKTLTLSGPGVYVFQSINNSGTTNRFVFDFKGRSTDVFRIYVHGDINLNKVSTSLLNGGSEAQIYTESHGTGSTSPTRKDAFTISNGSAGSTTKWSGMVWAPYGSINVGSGTGGSDIFGSLWSNHTVTLQNGVKISRATIEDLSVIPATPPPLGGKYDKIIGSELNSLFVNGQIDDELSKNVFLIEDESVYIEVISKIGKYDELLALLQTSEYGLTNLISNGPNSLIITGKYPIANLRKLDLLTDLIDYVRPLFPPVSSSGIANSQGDISMHTDFVRNGYDVSGEGVRVGVLSDSYNTILGNPAQTDVENGDLPGPANPENINPVKVLKEFPFGRRSDEGRAMLQIVHDVAPKASLAFRTGFISAGDFALGIKELQQDNCKVIVDDITFITEPFFQDGVVARAVNEVAGLGVSYFSAAGNYGNKSYQGTFNPVTAPNGMSGSAHNFAGGDVFQNISLTPGAYTIVLQWTDAIYSLGGNPLGTLNDLDIYLTDNNGATLFGFNRNNLGGDPLEILSFTATQNTNTSLLITRASGSQNVNFKYIIFRGEAVIAEHNTGNSTIVGQANAEGAMTVGAVLYTNTPAFGNAPSMASFSSLGGTPVDGVVRNKPDFAAPNGVNTTVQLGGVNIDNDPFPNFFGTSAAAPHAAAAAALLIDAKKKFEGAGITPSQLRTLLAASAIDIQPAGIDRASGSGFIQPNASIRSFASPKPYISELALPDTTIKPGTQEFTLTIKGDFLDPTSQVFLRNSALPTTFINSTTLQAVIPAFGSGNPSIYVNTPSVAVLQNDGGNSDTLYFFEIVQKDITITADNKVKKYGEAMPAFTASVQVDGIPLADTEFTLAELGLDSIKYTSPATSISNTGNYFIRPSMTALDPSDPDDNALIERYNYTFVDGLLNIQKLPLKITPRDTTLVYGNKIGDFNFQFDYNDAAIPVLNRSQFLSSLSNDYKENLANAIALVDAKSLVNGRALVNADLVDLTFLVSARALINARQLVNAKALINNQPVTTSVVDVAVKSIFDYQLYPDNATLVSARQLVNARALINAKALINGTATVNARSLVNGSPIVNSSTVDVPGADIVVIVDSLDFAAPPDDKLTDFKSIPLVTGTTAGEFTVVPGALLSNNFEITYGLGKLTILPAPLTVNAHDKVIYYGSPLPQFTSTIAGYQFDDSTTVSNPVYTLNPEYNGQPGIYSIIPSDLTFNPPNLSYQIAYTAGTLYVNPKGPGTRKIKPFLDCVEALTNDSSGFRYVAHFSYENPNSTPVYVPVGADNIIKSQGSFSGQPPALFLPGIGKFKIYFDGAKTTWTVKTYEVNKQSAVAAEASSSSSRCTSEPISNNLYQSSALTDDMKRDRNSSAPGSNLDLNEVQFYPNPVTDLVTVQWNNISDEEVIITDINGRTFAANNIKKLSENTLEVNMSGLNAGLYLLKVRSQQNYKVLRIIKL